MRNRHYRDLVFAAVLTALIVLFTLLVRIPFGMGGYAHLGDLIIYLAASFLPLPIAVLTAAVGGVLADIFSGYVMWVPFTLVLKALLVSAFTHQGKLLCKRNVLACGAGIVITTLGYYFAEVILYGTWAAFASIPWNLLQAAVCGAAYLPAALALDRLGFKRKFFQ